MRGVSGALTGSRGEDTRHAALLSAATIASQVITWAGVFVIATLYVAEDFGVFGTAQLIAGVGAFMSTWRLDQAALLPASDATARALVATATAGTCLTTAALAVVAVVVLVTSSVGIFGSPFATGVALVVPYALGTIATNWVTRSRRFGRLAAGNVARSVLRLVTATILGLAGLGAAGLFAAEAVAQLGAALIIADARPAGLRRMRASFAADVRVGIGYAKEHLRTFVGHGQLATALNLLGPLIVAWVIGRRFGLDVGGSYLLMQTIVTGPVTVIATALGQVVLGRAAEQERAGAEVAGHAAVLQWGLWLVAAVFAAVGVALAPIVVDVLTLDDWPHATFFLRILAVVAACRLAVLPIAQLYIVRQRQAVQAAIEAVRLAASVGWLVAGLGSSATVLAAGVAVISVAAYVVHAFALHRIARAPAVAQPIR